MSSVEATSAAVDDQDVRPILPVADDTDWDRAAALRDRFADAMAATLEREHVAATMLKSEPGNYPVWLRLEAWLPVEGARDPLTRERSQLDLIIQARPFNRHTLIRGARLVRGKRVIAVAESTRFSERDVAAWTAHAIGRGPRPSGQPFIGRRNPIDRRFRPRLFEPRTIVAAAVCVLFLLALLFRALLVPVLLAIGGFTLIAAVVLLAFSRRYRYHDWVVPQPREAPRQLHHVDSWHAVLIGLATEAESLRQAIIAAIGAKAGELAEIRSERYGYRTPNGYEERERIVVSHRQAHVYVHIYPSGDNLFVGWQAHLNWARWAETAPVSTMDAGRRRIAFRDIRPSWYTPTEYDVIDLEGLSALVHGALEREVKSLLTGRAIDQEIDFEVLRGDRIDALDQRKAWPERPDKRERVSNVIFGSGAAQHTSLGEMQLAPIDPGPARRRGLSAIPAVIVLPIVAVLLLAGNQWLIEALAQSGMGQSVIFQQSAADGFPFTFFPLNIVPVAATLAFGLWLYAGLTAVRALLVVALIETLSFCTSFAYLDLLSHSSQDFPAAQPNLASVAVGLALSSLCYLLASSLWVPSLRAPGRWLVAVVLWTAWAVANVWVVRNLQNLAPTERALVLTSSFSARLVFIAALFGFWLWRDEKMRSFIPARADEWYRPASSPSPRRTSAPGRRLSPATEPSRWRGAVPGIGFYVLAAFAFQAATGLSMGSGTALGPGSVPVALSVVLNLLAILIIIEGAVRRRVMLPLSFMSMLAVLAATAAFALTIRDFGLVVATALAAAIAAFYGLRGRVGAIIVVVAASVALTAGVASLFGVPVQLWPRLGGF